MLQRKRQRLFPVEYFKKYARVKLKWELKKILNVRILLSSVESKMVLVIKFLLNC